MAHKPHTKRTEKTSYRLGFGEIGARADQVCMARAIFLDVLRNTYPVIFEELKALLPLRHWEPGRNYLYDDAVQPEVLSWARRHNLVKHDRVPDWVIETAYNTLWDIQECGSDSWGYPTVEHSRTFIELEERTVGGVSINLHVTQLSTAKKRVPKSLHPELEAQVALALKRGAELSPWRCEPIHFTWAAWYLIGRGRGETTPGPSANPAAVRVEALAVLNLVGLGRRRGRPAKSH